MELNLDSLFPKPTLEPGENIVEMWLANRTQGFRGVGGRLYLTTHRVAFEPHQVEILLKSAPSSLPLGEVSSVELEAAEIAWAHLFDGGMRSRLKIVMKSGAVDLYVVNHPEEVAKRIQAALPASAA